MTEGEAFEVTIVHVGGERRTLPAKVSGGEVAVVWSSLNPPMRFHHVTGQAVLQKQRMWSLAPESRKPAGYAPEKVKTP